MFGTLISAVALTAFGTLSSTAARAAAPSDIAGHWIGTLVEKGAAMPVTFDFTADDGILQGDFSSDIQKCLDYPVDRVMLGAQRLTFNLGGSIQFSGTVAGDVITGSFTDAGSKGTFTLKRMVAPSLPYRAEIVHFRNGGVDLAGTLCTPLTPGPHPAILFTQGSGPETRWGTNRFWADRFARAGIAALCYDKRGCGASTGDWRQADFNDLAADAIAGIHLLQTRKEIDPKKVGIYGHSQGAAIAPLVASETPDLGFVIAADGFGGPMYQQDLFRVRTALADEGYAPADIEKAMTFYKQFLDVARTGNGMEKLDATLPTVQSEKWFPETTPPAHDNWLWRWYPKIGNFDTLAEWAKVRAPVLLIYGENDHNTPPHESTNRIEEALAKAGNTRYAAVFLPDAVHNDTIQPAPGKPFFWWHVAPGLSDIQIGWVREQVEGDVAVAPARTALPKKKRPPHKHRVIPVPGAAKPGSLLPGAP